MMSKKEGEPRYVRTVVNWDDDGKAAVSLEWLRTEQLQTRRTSRWLWAFLAFILLGFGVTVWLLFHPQAIEPVARAGEWLYGLLP